MRISRFHRLVFFLTTAVLAAASARGAEQAGDEPRESRWLLTGWRFQIDAHDQGAKEHWFDPGFELKSLDDEYQWQFHDLTQVDARVFQQGGQDPVKDTFDVPRQWFMISGRLTKLAGRRQNPFALV